MSVDRRELFRIISISAVAGGGALTQPASAQQHGHKASAEGSGPYTPRALSKVQYESLERMLEVLLPADETSPSARDAGVARYIDTTLHHGDERLRAAWVSGVDALSRESGGRAYGQLSLPEATAVLARIAADEENPSTEAGKFFVMFKQTAISAYYLADAGRSSLGYRGDTAVRDFPGCTHPEHKAL